MKNIISIIVIYIGLFLMDKRASSYGNGVIHLYKTFKLQHKPNQNQP